MVRGGGGRAPVSQPLENGRTENGGSGKEEYPTERKQPLEMICFQKPPEAGIDSRPFHTRRRDGIDAGECRAEDPQKEHAEQGDADGADSGGRAENGPGGGTARLAGGAAGPCGVAAFKGIVQKIVRGDREQLAQTQNVHRVRDGAARFP